MPFLIILILVILVLFAPQWWAQYTFRRYAKPLEKIPGTGGELARHLLDRFEMSHVKVEQTDNNNDHYDPTDKAVRLSPDNFSQRSLTAIAVAAHEVGHAIQDHQGEPLLAWRSRLAVLADAVQKVGAAAMVVTPLIAAVTRAPSASILLVVIGLGSMLLAAIVHLVTLPVEVDASFGKALPILEQGYIQTEDKPIVRRILRAAALTYLAASLASLLNLWRWISILKR